MTNREFPASASAGFGRRAFVGAAALATPMFFVRNGWAAGKSIYVGTYTGDQGDYIRKQVIPKFQSDFGCRVFQTENVTLGQIAILRTQKAAPTYSVMMMDDVGIPIAKNEGLIDRLPQDKIPNLAKALPGFTYNEGYGVACTISAVAPWYNSSLKPVESYADLWDPRFRGRFLMVTQKQTQSVQLLVMAAAHATGKPVLEAQYELDKAWDRMAELKPNVQTIFEIVGSAVLQVVQGQADVAGPSYSKDIMPYVMRKAPVRFSNPKEGSFAGVNCLTLVKGAPEPDLGAAFIDRMLSAAAQKGLAETIYAAPGVSGVDLKPDVAAIVPYPETRMHEMGLYVLDWNYINPRRAAIVDKFNQVFGT